jgi:DNA-binding CsgD family transcriptional regulator
LADSYLADRSRSRLSRRCGYGASVRDADLLHREAIMLMSGIVPGRTHSSWLVGERLPEVEIGVWHPSELSSAAAGVEFTRRELEVLRYLPSMLTAGEIAGELVVSVNTIKAHMRSIYRKLGVSRRRDAVVRAYECGVLRRRSFPHPAADVSVLGVCLDGSDHRLDGKASA